MWERIEESGYPGERCNVGWQGWGAMVLPGAGMVESTVALCYKCVDDFVNYSSVWARFLPDD